MRVEVPFDVLIKGPEAVALYLEHEKLRAERRAADTVKHIRIVMSAVGVDGSQSITREGLVAQTAALAHVLALIAYASAGGMRGLARDQLSEVIDGAFDVIEATETHNPELAGATEALRKAFAK